MAYIGKTPITGNFVKLDAISVVNGQAGYTMNNGGSAFTDYENVNQFLVSLNGILQAPTESFTFSGSTLTFAYNISTDDVIDFVIVLGNTLDIGTPSDSTVTQAKTNFVSTSSSAGLQIKGDSTTAGTLQLNCEQNSHGVKLRSPAHSSGQSYTLTLPTGNVTADKFLKVASISGSGTTATGQLSFADAGGGAYEKLLTTTASNSASVAFSSTYITSTHRDYKIVMSDIIAYTGAVNLFIYFSDDNGSSYFTTSQYSSATHGRNSSNSASTSYVDGGDAIRITGDTCGNNSARGLSGFIIIADPLNTSTKCTLYGQLGYHNNSNKPVAISFVGSHETNTPAINNIKIQFSSGNIVSGTFTLYGRKN